MSEERSARRDGGYSGARRRYGGARRYGGDGRCRLQTLPSFEVMKRAYDVVVAGLVEREDLTLRGQTGGDERG